MGKIFISYRREDRHLTKRIVKPLQHHFGEASVFIDEGIDAGDDWRARISEALGDSIVVLVVIGPNWLKSKERLKNEDDLVLFELSAALKSKNVITTIPLVVDVEVPDPHDLPPAVKKLVECQALHIHSDTDKNFESGVRQVIENLEKHVEPLPVRRELAAVRTRFLTATSNSELRQVQLAIDECLKNHPLDAEACFLSEQIRQAHEVASHQAGARATASSPRAWPALTPARIGGLLMAATLSWVAVSIISPFFASVQARRSHQLRSALPIPVFDVPQAPGRVEEAPERKLLLGPSAYWLPQTHPDARAVFDVTSRPSDPAIVIDAVFAPGDAEMGSGEVIVFVTQGAITEEHIRSFDLRAMAMGIQIPSGITASFFVKDDSWNSAYWDLSIEDHGKAQQIMLDVRETAPNHKDAEFAAERAIAVGWKFYSNDYEGAAELLVTNVTLQFRPTDHVAAVGRCALSDFRAQSGVDLPVVRGQLDFGSPIDGGRHEGLSKHLSDVHSCLSFLAEQHVALARIAMFEDLRTGVVLDDRGQIAELDKLVIADMDALLAEVSQYPNMRLLLVLFGGSLADRWPNLIINATERQALCDRVLQPLFNQYASSEVIYGVEVVSDPERLAQVYGDQAVRVFADDILRTIREVAPDWKAVIGHRSRAGVERFQFPGFDTYTFYHDAMNARHDVLKFRRDRMEFPPAGVPVLVVARLPRRELRTSGVHRPPFSSFAIQDAYDYGYSGILLSSLNSDDGRTAFQGAEANSFAAWMSQATDSDSQHSEPKD